jgi:hypothetical protein
MVNKKIRKLKLEQNNSSNILCGVLILIIMIIIVFLIVRSCINNKSTQEPYKITEADSTQCTSVNCDNCLAKDGKTCLSKLNGVCPGCSVDCSKKPKKPISGACTGTMNKCSTVASKYSQEEFDDTVKKYEDMRNDALTNPQTQNTLLRDALQAPWEGWASTSQFGCGDGPWVAPDAPQYAVWSKLINNPTIPSMGAAIPWRFIFNEYGTGGGGNLDTGKKGQIITVVKSLRGDYKPSDTKITKEQKACYMIQPINCSPHEITDINDDNIAATVTKNGTKQKFPEYLIIPFEGCGGNCIGADCSDCFNKCYGSTNYDTKNAIFGDFCSDTGDCSNNPQCNFMNTLKKNGKLKEQYKYTGTLDNSFDKTKSGVDSYSIDFINKLTSTATPCMSNIFAVDPTTGYHTDEKGTANWCSGNNMHFDMAMTCPYWMFFANGDLGDIQTTNAASNIFVRWKRVPCNIYGNQTKSDYCSGNSQCGPDCWCPDGYHALYYCGPQDRTSYRKVGKDGCKPMGGTSYCCKTQPPAPPSGPPKQCVQGECANPNPGYFCKKKTGGACYSLVGNMCPGNTIPCTGKSSGSTGTCKCGKSDGHCGGNCTTITNEQQCTNASTSWGCEWTT